MLQFSQTILVATYNTGKIPEIIDNLDLSECHFITLDVVKNHHAPQETGATYEENARIKALAARQSQSAMSVLADDSGIEVDALLGAPGIQSARFAGDDATDIENVEKLLRALHGVDEGRRTARFVCTIVFIDEVGNEIVTQGFCEGKIAESPRGSNGFGYDPVFIPDEIRDERTMGELTCEEKNRISHRGKALRALREILLAHSRAETPAETPAEAAAETPAEAAAETPAETPAEAAAETPAEAAAEAPAEAAAETPAEAPAETPAAPEIASRAASQATPVSIAAFDFDETILEGRSPVRMVRQFSKKRVIPLRTGFRMLWWGIRYKLHMQVEQEVVRECLFSAFTHLPAEETNQMMADFYHEDLQRRLRPRALEVIKEHRAAGDKIVLVSASFSPILKEAKKDLEADWFICTQMEIVDGYYTGTVAHMPPEGEQKLIQLNKWADREFSETTWSLSTAYGDHRSDVPLMAAAQKAVAVNPDRILKRIAKRNNWEITDWSFKVKRVV